MCKYIKTRLTISMRNIKEEKVELIIIRFKIQVSDFVIRVTSRPTVPILRERLFGLSVLIIFLNQEIVEYSKTK